MRWAVGLLLLSGCGRSTLLGFDDGCNGCTQHPDLAGADFAGIDLAGRDFAGIDLLAYTAREGNYVIASTLCERRAS